MGKVGPVLVRFPHMSWGPRWLRIPQAYIQTYMHTCTHTRGRGQVSPKNRGGGSARRGVSVGSQGSVTLRAVFLQSLRGERGSAAGPAWVRVGHGSGLRRPLASGSHAAAIGGRDAAATDAADPYPYSPPLRPAGGTRPPLPLLHLGCPDAWREAAGPVTGLPVLAAPRYPRACTRPCPSRQLSRGSARGPISRRPFPGDSSGGAVSPRSPASGSRAEPGRLWLRRRAAQGGSAEAMGMAHAASRVSGTPGGPRPFSGPQFLRP